MSDDASPPTADWPRRHPHHDHDAEGAPRPPDNADDDDDHDDDHDVPDPAVDLADQKRRIQTKRIGYLEDLLRNLDILIYAEISAVYYLDCSFLRFVLRAFVQLIWLTPKPDLLLPDGLPTNRPYIYPLGGANLVCLASHLWFAAPAAGEATRGYLHGGLLIDWIGQQAGAAAGAAKARLVLLDAAILALQIVMLAATLKLQAVKKRGRRGTGTGTGTAAAAGGGAAMGETGAAPAPAPRQDVDAEEMGILRRSSSGLSSLVDHSLHHQHHHHQQRAGHGSGSNGDGDGDERDELLPRNGDGVDDDADAEAPRLPERARNAAALDALDSGRAVVAQLFVVDTVREQVDVALNPASTAASGADGAGARSGVLTGRDRRRQLAAALARRRLALATRFGAG